jgi:hypothetical protein
MTKTAVCVGQGWSFFSLYSSYMTVDLLMILMTLKYHYYNPYLCTSQYPQFFFYVQNTYDTKEKERVLIQYNIRNKYIIFWCKGSVK